MGDELGPARCPVCATDLTESVRSCPRCSTPHHEDCWDYAGGCAVFGCASRGLVPAGMTPGLPMLTTERLVNAWYWSFQGLRLTMAILLAPFFAWIPLLPLGWVIGFRLAEELWVVVMFGSVAGFLGSLALALPITLLRWMVERRFGGPLVGDPRKASALARRMEGHGTLWWLVYQGREVARWISAFLVVTGFGGVGIGKEEGFLVLMLGVAAVFVFLVLEAYHDSAVQIASVQNRLVASSKG